MLKSLAALFLGTLLFAACDTHEKPVLDLLLSNASIVDIETNSILKNRIIGIRNDTIRFVGIQNEDPLPKAKQIIDLKGQYVMPGLWDMHVHFRGGESLVKENKELLPLFLAFGITTVRDAGGDISSDVFMWRDSINMGLINGPRIFSSGPKLDGSKPAWPGSLRIEKKEDIKVALDSLQYMKADYVKFYDGSLEKELYYATIEEAERRGLKTTGHMPLTAKIEEAAELGLDGSEHMYYLLKSCSAKSDSLNGLNLGYGMFKDISKSYDPDIAKELFTMLAEKDFYVTPTLHISKVLTEILDVDHEKDTLKTHVGPGIRATYTDRVERAKKAKAEGSNTRKQVLERGIEMIVPMQRAGLKILAGSDCGASNSYVYPGESLLSELNMLVKSGLSPSEALKTSVINGPTFFNLQNYYGSIKIGKIADLIVLEQNPLDDIQNLEKLTWLIRKNKAHSHKELMSQLSVYAN